MINKLGHHGRRCRRQHHDVVVPAVFFCRMRARNADHVMVAGLKSYAICIIMAGLETLRYISML